MGNVLRSLDDQISAWSTYGAVQRCFSMAQSGTTTAATATSGYVTMQKYPGGFTVPAPTSPVTGFYCSRLKMVGEDALTTLMAAYATNLGSINMNTGTFTDGSAMPTRTVKGSSVTTSGQMVVAVVTTAVTATTPLVTITYTDQDGNTGNSAAMTLPTSPALNSVFNVYPHLATGDTGIRDITAVTKSAGTAGVITFYGLHIINVSPIQSSAAINRYPHVARGIVPWVCSGGDNIQFYRTGATTTSDILATFTLQPDV